MSFSYEPEWPVPEVIQDWPAISEHELATLDAQPKHPRLKSVSSAPCLTVTAPTRTETTRRLDFPIASVLKVRWDFEDGAKRHSKETSSETRVHRIPDYGIAAQLLASWVEDFPSSDEMASNIRLPRRAFDNLNRLRQTVGCTRNIKIASPSELERHIANAHAQIANAHAWLRLQGRSALLLHELSIGNKNHANFLNRRLGIGLEDPKGPSCWKELCDALFPSRTLENHFALRSACCVSSSFRALKLSELFLASTTIVLDDDPEWPEPQNSLTINSQRLLSFCQHFLSVDSDGFVNFKDNRIADLFSRYLIGFARDAHHFMAAVCLKHIERMSPRLLLEPWEDFQRLERNFPLHNYVVTFWQYHYGITENYTDRLVSQLKLLLDDASIAITRENHCQSRTHQDSRRAPFKLMPAWFNATIEIGFHFAKRHQFHKLAAIYESMGARMQDWDCCICGEGPPDGKQAILWTKVEGLQLDDSDEWHMVSFTDLEGCPK